MGIDFLKERGTHRPSFPAPPTVAVPHHTPPFAGHECCMLKLDLNGRFRDRSHCAGTAVDGRVAVRLVCVRRMAG